jgi:hypothetical protein
MAARLRGIRVLHANKHCIKALVQMGKGALSMRVLVPTVNVGTARTPGNCMWVRVQMRIVTTSA